MPNHCVAPGCDYRRGNFDGKRSLFLFPRDPEQRRRWLKSIPRADYQPSKNAQICEVHFEERFIIRQDSAMRPDGTILTCKRGKPKLANEAISTRFPSLLPVSNEKGNLSRFPLKPRKRVRKPDPIQQNLGLKWMPCNMLARMKKEAARNQNCCPAAFLFCQDSIVKELAPVGNRIRDRSVPTHAHPCMRQYPI